MKENQDYYLMPIMDDNDQRWNIRILTGQFCETVIEYGVISLDKANDCLRWNFSVVYSPDDELTETDKDLQNVAGEILEDIMQYSAEESQG